MYVNNPQPRQREGTPQDGDPVSRLRFGEGWDGIAPPLCEDLSRPVQLLLGTAQGEKKSPDVLPTLLPLPEKSH